VCMAELPSLPLNEACDRPACITSKAAAQAVSPSPVAGSAAGGAAPASPAAATASSAPDTLRSHLAQLLTQLLPPITECIARREQAAKRRKTKTEGAQS